MSPYSVALDSEAKLGIVHFAGVVTKDDMIAGAQALYHVDGWKDSFDVIWDCSRVKSHKIGPEELHPLADEVAEGGEGHDALIESVIEHDDLFTDLLVRLLRRRGKTASAHRNMDGALRSLGHDALPVALEG